ncbi:MAG: hypothetical protein EGQ91_00715 [Clostridiales bacterium]|nr:hypothetical protein [Clostridiales bacterium]
MIKTYTALFWGQYIVRFFMQSLINKSYHEFYARSRDAGVRITRGNYKHIYYVARLKNLLKREAALNFGVQNYALPRYSI